MTYEEFQKIKTIEEMQNLLGGTYIDKKKDPTDGTRVSCLQDEKSGYSELEDKFNEYYSEYPEHVVAKAMAIFCLQKKEILKDCTKKDQWECFYDYMDTLGIKKVTSQLGKMLHRQKGDPTCFNLDVELNLKGRELLTTDSS